MADKALYVLAGYDESTEQRLAGIQNGLYRLGFTGTHTKNIPQHITLGSFPVEQEAELVDLVHRTADTTVPFEVTFNHVGLFTGAKVLFIAPDTSKELLELKEHFGNSYGWTPHTTMLIDEQETVLNALPEVIRTFSSFRGSVTSLHLYEFFPARHILTVELKGKTA